MFVCLFVFFNFVRNWACLKLSIPNIMPRGQLPYRGLRAQGRAEAQIG